MSPMVTTAVLEICNYMHVCIAAFWISWPLSELERFGIIDLEKVEFLNIVRCH